MKLDNSRSKELGMTYRPIEQTLIDMGYSLIKNKIIPDKIKSQPNLMVYQDKK